MADSKGTPDNQDITPETQIDSNNNPGKSKLEALKEAGKTTILAITGFGLGAMGIIQPGTAHAGGLPPDELGKQEKATIEANGGIIKIDDLKGQLAKLEVKNPDEVAKMYEGLDDLDKSLIGKYLNIGLKSPNNTRLKNGVVNLIIGLNNKKIYTAFLQKPTWETAPEGTTAINFAIAYKGFPGAELIITKEMLIEIKGLDKEVVRVRTEIANNKIKVADEQILDIQKVSEGIDKINELSGKIIKATGI